MKTIFIFFLLFHLTLTTSRKSCFKGKCVCFKRLKLIDCSKLQLETVPMKDKEDYGDYETISLRFNKLKKVNISSLLFSFPTLKVIDIRQNPNLDCAELLQQNHFGITLLSDCEPKTTTTSTTRFTTPTKKGSTKSTKKVSTGLVTSKTLETTKRKTTKKPSNTEKLIEENCNEMTLYIIISLLSFFLFCSLKTISFLLYKRHRVNNVNVPIPMQRIPSPPSSLFSVDTHDSSL